MTIKPLVLAMLVCRRVEKTGTGDTLVDVSWSFPLSVNRELPALSVYIVVKEVYERMPLTLRVRAGEQIICTAPFEIDVPKPNPAIEHDCVLNLPGITVPETDDVVFEAVWENRVLAEQRIHVSAVRR